MISYYKGDLIKAGLNGKIDYILHSCNLYHTFGAGIAATIRTVIPEAYKADLTTVNGDINKMGTYSYASTNKLTVINGYCQFPYDNRDVVFDYDSLAKVLNGIKAQFGNVVLGIPFIGCGIAGGSWEKVIEVLENSGLTFRVVIFSERDLNNIAPFLNLDFNSLPSI